MFSSKMSLLALPKKGPGVLPQNVHRPPGPNADLPAQPGHPELLPVLLPPILPVKSAAPVPVLPPNLPVPADLGREGGVPISVLPESVSANAFLPVVFP
eukprot:7839396-Heterocapsa_arctica.AAC.1